MSKTNRPDGKRHLVWKWFLGIFAFIFLVAVAAAIYINNKWRPLLTETIQNTVIQTSDSLYRVKFSNIKINLLTGSAYLDSVVIYPDTLIYQKMVRQRIAPENLFELSIRTLGVNRVNPLKVYYKRVLDIDAINIQEPELTITYRQLKNKIRKREDTRSTYEKMKDVLRSAKLSTLFLTSVKFRYVDQSAASPQTYDVDQLNIRVNDILIDSASQNDTSRIFHAKDIIAELNNYKYATADSTYLIRFKQLFVSTLKKELVLNGVSLKSRLDEMKFSNLFPRQHEMYEFNFDTIQMKGIHFPELIDYRSIIASNVKLKKGALYAFLNRAKPMKGIDKGANFPHVLLSKLNMNVQIDSVQLQDIDVSYREYNPKTNSKGTVKFDDLTGNIYHVTNDSAQLSKSKYAHAYLNTKLMGRSALNIHIRFDQSDQQGRFSYDGHLKSLPFTVLNPLSKPLGKILFSDGTLNRIDFSASGDRRGAKGKVTINYSDMNVKLLKNDDEDGGLKRMGVISLLANVLVLKNDNPSKGEPIRVTYPQYERPDDASFFNLMWKIIFFGFKETVGISAETEAKMMKNAQKFKERKERREKRKQEREEKREARKND